MKLYNIQRKEDYIKLLKYLLEGGLFDAVENEQAFFGDDLQTLLEYFEIDERDVKLWDDDGEPLWNVDEEIPDWFWNNFVTQRLKDIDMSFPFMIYVHGDVGTCLDNVNYREFIELYPERP